MLEDATTSIKAYLYERAVSPLLGSLIVSWCFWNYRFFFLAVSDLKYAEKMAEIDKFYQLEDTHNLFWLVEWTVSNFWALGVVFPFITAMLYLFAFPYPAKWVYQFSLKRQEILASVKNDIEDKKRLSVEQSRAIRQQLTDFEKASDELVERKDRAIEARDRQIEELQSQVTELQESLEEASKVLDGRLEESEREAEHLTEIADELREWEENQLDDNSFGVVTDIGIDDKDTPLPEQPAYIKFYSNLNRAEQNAVEDIIVTLLDNEATFENLQSDIQRKTPHSKLANDTDALKRIIGKMKVYNIVDTYNQGILELFSVVEDGKLLYRHILENPSEPDSIDNEDKEEGNDLSFYFNADEYTQARYKRILEGLFLEDRGKHEFQMQVRLFDAAMVQLILHRLVQQLNDTGKYRITEEGRSFYTNLNNMKAG